MVRNVFKRFSALIMSMALILTMMPLSTIPVYAAGTLDVGIDELEVSYESGDWTCNSGTITASFTTTQSSGCMGPEYHANSGTLTLKNTSGGKVILSYSVTLSGNGTVSDTGNGYTVLENDASVKIVVSSSDSSEDTSVVTINNFILTPVSDITVAFMPAEHGSYTVDGTAISARTEITQSSEIPFNMSVIPETGYQFLGWEDANGKIISTATSKPLFITENTTITASFVPNGTATFYVDGTCFSDLNEATAYATEKGKDTIVLISSGALPSGNYSIPPGKLFLIPFDDTLTRVTSNETVIYNEYVTPTAFKTLSMEEGAHIEVYGDISLASQMSTKGQLNGTNGAPTGPDGRILMKSDSSITIKDGGNLYAYGYISGNGAIEAESGSKVYENFQIKDWRGGSATMSISSYAFPLSQYYVQNIEVPLTLEAGAEEICNSAVNASSSSFSTSVGFVGPNGMFEISSGTLTKVYEAASDRLIITIDGTGGLNAVSLSGLPIIGSVSSSDFELPINSNITVKCLSGSRVSIGQDIKLLPSAELDIEEGATATIGNGTKMYLYDTADWDNFTGSAKLYVVGYSASNGTTTKRSANGLVDARIDVNGTLNVDGALFTTNGGADIVSSNGTGKVVLSKKPTASATIYEMANNKTKTSVNVTAAKLHNGQRYAGTDDEYTETADMKAGDEVPYSKVADKWGEVTKVTVSFDANGGTGSMDPVEVEAGEEYPIPDNGFVPAEGKVFTGWNTKADGSGTPYAPGATATLTEDTTLYAQWETNSYTVAFNANGHGTAPDSQIIEHGQKVTKPADPSEAGWVFGGWYTEPECEDAYDFDAPVKAPLTLYAKWTEDTAIVTFKSQDGTTVLGEQTVAIGQKPTYNAEPPAKDSTDQYEYTFEGWATTANQEDGSSVDDLPAVTGDVTYFAAFSKAARKYTIVFQNEDGSELQNSEVAYGEIPVYTGSTPTKAADETYTYAFKGWDKEPAAVTGAATYTATYDSEFINYTVIFYEEDGTTKISEKNYHYGETVEVPEAPEKPATAEKTYTFDKWEPSVQTIVAGNANYTASYSEEINKYNVYWVSDGNTIETDENVEYGSTPSFGGNQPVKEKSAQYSYEFVGWNTDPEASTGVNLNNQTITGNTTYYAIFEATVNSYTVKFLDEDGLTVLDEQTLDYGEIPEYKGETPSKESDDQYDYTWIGWDKGLSEVTDDVIYTAVYDKYVKNYTVTFMDEDGETVLSTQSVAYGTVPEYANDTPTKVGDAQYTYEFDGWEPDLVEVTKDVTYTAKFRKTLNSYTIKFVDEDGETILSEQTVDYGETPEYKGEEPTKEGTAEYAYTFIGWTPEVCAVTGEATYTAVYSATVKTYAIKFVDEDGNILDEQAVEYGKIPEYKGEIPVKEGTDEFSYEYTGWTPEVCAVTGEAIYTAVFSEVKNKYAVKFVDEDETTVLDEQLVEYGEVPEYKGATPTKESTNQFDYAFAGWDKELTAVTGEATYKATYSETIRKYRIRFLDEDGTELQSTEVDFGGNPEYNGETPAKSETPWYTYEFIGWNPEPATVTGEAEYTAIYKENKKLGWITDEGKTYFVKDDGELAKGTFETSSEDESHTATFAFDPETGEFRKDLTGVYTDGNDYYWVDNGEVRFEEGLVRINETQEYYYFGEDGKAYTGETKWVEKNNDLLPQWDYTFGEDGIIVHEDVNIDGPTKVGEDTYYYIDGIRVHMGLVKDGDDYYYYKRDGLMIRDKDYWISRLNGLDADDDRISEKSYHFDEDGRMILPTAENKNGIYEEDGSLFYYVDGKRTYAGLIEIDGSFYYVRTNGEVVHGRDYWITKTNGLMEEKSYIFDENGKMVIVSKKNGIIEEDGKLFYYKDDVKTYAGLFEQDGDYYYAKTSGELVCGRSYWITKTNGLMPEKSYTFDETGKITDPDVVDDTELNGIVKEGDNIFYYVDGVKTYAGLIEIDGAYYYVRTDGSVVHGKKYWITKTNGLMKEASYTFDDDGKMVQ